MSFIFDLAPRVFLAIGVVLLGIGALAYAFESGLSVVTLGMGALFLIVALVTAYSSDR